MLQVPPAGVRSGRLGRARRPTRRPHPAWAQVDAQLRQADARLDRLQAEYGLEAFTNREDQRRTVRGFKIAEGRLGHQSLDAWHRVETLQVRRGKTHRQVPAQCLHEEPVVQLAPEFQHLTNLLKMVAYQTESELFRQLAPHYRRAHDEGRTLLHSAFASAADLHVTDQELRVSLAPRRNDSRAFCAEVHFAGDRGWTVVSDIDDTFKEILRS